MSEVVSVTGGLLATVSLDATEVAAAQAALKAAGKSFTDGDVHSNLSQAPAASALNVYDITAVAGKTYTQGAGEQVVILQGSASATLIGRANVAGNLLIGDSGNDTIKTTGGTGTIFLGDGSNGVSVTGGAQTIYTGASTSTDKITMTGGHVYVEGQGKNSVSVTGGADTIGTTGTLQISVQGNDTITLGVGKDTIVATGSVTLTGGSGQFRFKGGVNSVIHAGSSDETLVGGTGNSTFYGGNFVNSHVSMEGGAGPNLFVGGEGHTHMYAHVGSANTYEFTTTSPGGSDTIIGYHSATDKIELKGYTSANITHIGTTGGNTIINLSDGTTIQVNAATVTAGQIKFI